MKKRISRKHFRLRIDEMIATLRQEIMSGKYAVGSYLPSENDLEERFELSNASVRNALKVLVDEGLIEKIARVGNRVTSPPPGRETVIKFGYVHDIADLVEMERLLAEFHRLHPQIRVQPVELPSSSYSQTLKEYMDSGLLDAVIMNNNNFQDFAEQGSLDLLERVEPMEDGYPFLTKPFQRGEDILVQPFIYSPVVLCYNKDHFDEAGVPVPDSSWTWRDLFACGRRIAVKNERFGFYFYLPSRNRWPIFMLQSGARFEADAEGRFRLPHGTRLVESLETCKEVLGMTDVFPRILSESDADAEALFLKGKVSVIMTTYFFLNQLRASGIAFDVSPLPGLHDSSTLLIVNGLAVNSKSANKGAARLLVDFLTSYETQLYLRRHTLNITAHRRAMAYNGDEAIYRPSRFYLYREIFPTLRLITELGLTNVQLKSIQRDIMLFLSGLQDGESLRVQLESLLNPTATEEVKIKE